MTDESDAPTQNDDLANSGDIDPEQAQQLQEAMGEARARLAEVPAETVVVNHVMGLYELAAIHLSAETPDLPASSLAIDAMAAIVDTLGDRLGEHTTTMRDALANIRLAYTAVKNR